VTKEKQPEDQNNRTDELICDVITKSAKTRFDYESYAVNFEHMGNGYIADNFLFKTICEFAAGKNIAAVSSALNSEMLVVGYRLEKDWLADYLANKEEELKKEIQATHLARSMLADGCPSDMALAVVLKML
jgi:hypothetical protein